MFCLSLHSCRERAFSHSVQIQPTQETEKERKERNGGQPCLPASSPTPLRGGIGRKSVLSSMDRHEPAQASFLPIFLCVNLVLLLPREEVCGGERRSRDIPHISKSASWREFAKSGQARGFKEMSGQACEAGCAAAVPQAAEPSMVSSHSPGTAKSISISVPAGRFSQSGQVEMGRDAWMCVCAGKEFSQQRQSYKSSS